MNSKIATSMLLMLLLCAPSQSRAEAHHCPDEICVEHRRPRGTHFLVELNGGFHLDLDGGGAQALMGVGGKLRGFPLRFYLVGEVGLSSIDRITHAEGNAVQDLRSNLDLAAGLRIYCPLMGPVRLFVDALAGASRVDATIHRQGQGSLRSGGFFFSGILGAGVQYRLVRSLSLGMRLRVALAEDGLAEPRRALMGSSSTRTAITGGITWHF